MTIRETVLSQQRQAFAELLILQLNDEPQKGRAVAMLHVAREGGEIVGVCTYGPARGVAFAGWGEVVSLYVQPERMGRGIGSKLLGAALEALATEGFEDAYLWVLADNASARAFY